MQLKHVNDNMSLWVNAQEKDGQMHNMAVFKINILIQLPCSKNHIYFDSKAISFFFFAYEKSAAEQTPPVDYLQHYSES